MASEIYLVIGFGGDARAANTGGSQLRKSVSHQKPTKSSKKLHELSNRFNVTTDFITAYSLKKGLKF